MSDEIPEGRAMGELVERVARAICEAEIGGPLPGSLDETGERSAAHWRALARAALGAMPEYFR